MCIRVSNPQHHEVLFKAKTSQSLPCWEHKVHLHHVMTSATILQ